MSKIDPPAGWPDVDGIDPFERLLGGPLPNSPINRSIGNVTARTEFLRESVDTNQAATAAFQASLSASTGAALVGFTPAGAGAVLRTAQAKMRERVSVKDFGAIGDGAPHPLSEFYGTLSAAQAVYPFATNLTDQVDWCAFIAARNALLTGSEYQGGTIYVPRGRYQLNKSVQFDDFADVTNFYIQGDGAINTVLDFNLAAPGQDGIVFVGGSFAGLKDLMITHAKRHGIVLNNALDSFVSMVSVENVRVQNCVGDGLYSLQSYLVGIDKLYSSSNGGNGVNFAGNHTSIVTNRMYALYNGANGIVINGAVYVDINAQSDHNLRGYVLSNIRGGILRAPGSESNKGEGILIVTSNASTTNLFPEYQNIEGLVIEGACQIRNNTDGPVGNNANIAVITADSRPAKLTLIGCVDTVVTGDPSLALSGAAGEIECTLIDCVFSGSTVKSGTTFLNDVSVSGRSAFLRRDSGAFPVADATEVLVEFDGFITGANSLGASLASSGTRLVMPKGVNRVVAAACVNWASGVTGNLYMAITKNGVPVAGLPQARITAPSGASCPMTLSSSAVVEVTEGDYFSVLLVQTSGTAQNIEGSSAASNWLSITAAG